MTTWPWCSFFSMQMGDASKRFNKRFNAHQRASTQPGQGIIHRDMKLENVLVANERRPSEWWWCWMLHGCYIWIHWRAILGVYGEVFIYQKTMKHLAMVRRCHMFLFQVWKWDLGISSIFWADNGGKAGAMFDKILVAQCVDGHGIGAIKLGALKFPEWHFFCRESTVCMQVCHRITVTLGSYRFFSRRVVHLWSRTVRV